MLPTSAERPSARSLVEGRAFDLTISCSASAQAPWPAAWAVERAAPGASPEDFSAPVQVLDGYDTLGMLNAAAAKVAEKKSYIYMERYDELHSASPGTERSSYRPCEIFLDFPTAIPLGYTEMRPSWIPGRCPCCGTADCGQGTLCVCSPSTWCWARAPRTSGLWQPRSVQQTSREQPFRARRCLTWATTRRTRTATLDLSERRRDALAHASHRSLATHLSSCVARPRRQWRGPTSSRSVPSAEPIGVTRGQLGH
jgi:hypothetical protein